MNIRHAIHRLTTVLLTLLFWSTISSLALGQEAGDSLRVPLQETGDSLRVPLADGQWPTLPEEIINDELPPLPEINRDSIDAEFQARYGDNFIYRDTYFERFNPIPAKAVWYAALFPGGGQIYNRKYWKLPIIYGGFLGLIYGYRFNQRYYRTYSNAYRDLVLGSPNASYKEFLSPNYPIKERYDYLERSFKRKRNSYRNYRDYCVVGMIGVYLVAMVDAYVDAALYHFDVSPELDANNQPALMLGYSINF